MNTTDADLMSPGERSAVARREAMPARVARIVTLKASLDRHSGLLRQHFINGVNVAREIGIELVAMCGHEQMSLAFFTALKESGQELPLEFERAKGFMAIARDLPQPAETFDQAYAVHKRAFVQMELIQLESGGGNGSAGDVDEFLAFVNDFTRFKARVFKLPIDKLSPERRHTLRADLQWAAELYEQLGEEK